jgi:hypothetical protein
LLQDRNSCKKPKDPKRVNPVTAGITEPDNPEKPSYPFCPTIHENQKTTDLLEKKP